jgi:hypothetical protein
MANRLIPIEEFAANLLELVHRQEQENGLEYNELLVAMIESQNQTYFPTENKRIHWVVGAPIGNKNAIGQQDTERPFREALNRAIKQDDGKRIRSAAEKLLDLAADGEQWAVKELADRVDGKASQQVNLDANVKASVVITATPLDENIWANAQAIRSSKSIGR